jgi:hypothetical protein
MVVARLCFEDFVSRYVFRFPVEFLSSSTGLLPVALSTKHRYFNRIIGQNECNARLLTLLHPTNSIVENKIEVSQEFCGVILIEQLPQTHRVKLVGEIGF